jgi:hypothetical protein
MALQLRRAHNVIHISAEVRNYCSVALAEKMDAKQRNRNVVDDEDVVLYEASLSVLRTN